MGEDNALSRNPIAKPGFVPGERICHLSERLDFSCQGCGGCCTDTTPFVTPQDVWELARKLGMSTSDVLQEFLIIRYDRLSEGGPAVPMLCLDMKGPAAQCGLLDPDNLRCRAYAERPLSCRLFPAGIRHLQEPGGSWRDQWLLVHPLPECRGYGRGIGTVGDYVREQGLDGRAAHARDYAAFAREIFGDNLELAEEEAFGEAFLGALFDLDSRPGRGFEERYENAKGLVRGWI